ncbi:hypothetical protein CKK33_17435 [Mucilaginibacter sp. MD40]|uniref:RagB/SusD family nutrient uptake outer membrane protein n=1 Tax=Mucilaginibacter sp. MD40 TaxID=2029590 RepID=UPI000BAC79C2|nr:RagB/SusD family nutrient uptake outer membrane protein [Mucilaginibacter sp. MD40]PAW95185.1 hypothetical protein CKK33_17435 [Mucilaginibacter sp. MD40]
MKIIKFNIGITIALLVILSGCKKYLDAKSDKSLVIISNTQDLQSLLDDNQNINWSNPSSDEASSDEYYLDYSSYLALPEVQKRNLYTWQPTDLFRPYTNLPNDWNLVYNNIYVANTVLDNMIKVNRNNANASDWDNIKGQALFLRAHSFYKAATIWTLAYDNTTSSSDLGIPLRLNSNFNEISVRSTNEQTYTQIINDLKAAIPLLVITPVHVLRASKPAAYGLLARTYLSMRKYDLAALYADSCLQLKNSLLDYNTLNALSAYPIPQFNSEVIYDATVGGYDSGLISDSQAKIDSVLYSSYAANDLRKILFFTTNGDGSHFFKGSYEGTFSQFNGVAIDEIYLIRAECNARQGHVNNAMSDLNTLLAKRYKSGTFTPISASNSSDALSKILTERHKELVMRGNRWADIKRLNKEGAGINLNRNLNGKIFTLPANDLRFALPLPNDIIALSGMQQNPR